MSLQAVMVFTEQRASKDDSFKQDGFFFPLNSQSVNVMMPFWGLLASGSLKLTKTVIKTFSLLGKKNNCQGKISHFLLTWCTKISNLKTMLSRLVAIMKRTKKEILKQVFNPRIKILNWRITLKSIFLYNRREHNQKHTDVKQQQCKTPEPRTQINL